MKITKTCVQKIRVVVKCVVTVCVCMCLSLSFFYHSYGETNFHREHEPPMCANPGHPIKISAKIIAPTLPKEARVYFKKQGTMPFYFVPMKQEGGGTYTGIIPAPVATTRVVEYVILVVQSNGNIQTSPSYFVLISNEPGCPKYLHGDQSEIITVYAESPISPEIGFSGKNVQWNVTNYSGTAYLDSTMKVQAQSFPASSPEREQKRRGPLLDKKTLIGIGAGLGAAVVVAVLLSGGEEGEKVNWNLAVGERADDVDVECIKIPDVQTSCGTLVMNRLFVTNERAEPLAIDTIDYEVVLTKDDPAGSCEEGRTGTFMPNLASVVQPGETALIREWSHEVNPCSECPYLIAECQWRSQYIVHTSAGDAVAKSTFTVEGDLCGLPAAKSLNDERLKEF